MAVVVVVFGIHHYLSDKSLNRSKNYLIRYSLIYEYIDNNKYINNGSLITQMHSVYEILIRLHWFTKVLIMRVIYSFKACNNSLAVARGTCFKRDRTKYPPNLDWLAPSATHAFRIELMHNVNLFQRNSWYSNMGTFDQSSIKISYSLIALHLTVQRLGSN